MLLCCSVICICTWKSYIDSSLLCVTVGITLGGGLKWAVQPDTMALFGKQGIPSISEPSLFVSVAKTLHLDTHLSPDVYVHEYYLCLCQSKLYFKSLWSTELKYLKS